ncbi:DNA polymerase III subunit delta [Cytobacillus sp. IB215316]|uniref:DNA polymerase III subunit delta n=1 Tax=Cytobacillus sp. IB215316 TaxID=3097354 RepID=UPI002A0EDFCF|nr:DNA polymerase III subunit delta [Cytobacillus sp. IB215316]MDX8359525.1 DNA polymerase III subunit delta [Cytobacillus sp. IB215316]
MALDIWRKIKQENINNLYLLYGKETYLLNETKKLLISHGLKNEEIEFNLSTYNLEETPIEAGIEDAETYPFFGDKKIVIFNNPTFLTSEKSKIEHDLKKLETFINQPADFSIIVFYAPYEKLDERKKLTKLLKKKAELLVANTLTEQELQKWIVERAESFQVLIQNEAVEEMLRLVGTNLMLLTTEIDKLALYVGPGGNISHETVTLLVARTLEQNIFTLIDFIVQRKPAEAMQILFDLIEQKEEPIKILSLVSNQFRLIYQVKELARQGYNQQKISSIIKVHPYRVKLAAGQAKLFGDQELKGIIGQLAEADYDMKVGNVDKQLILELFIMSLQEQIH